MHSAVHPDTILDLFRRALSPSQALGTTIEESQVFAPDPSIEAAFSGASREDLAAEPLENPLTPIPYSEYENQSEPEESEAKTREAKIAHLLASFKVPL